MRQWIEFWNPTLNHTVIRTLQRGLSLILLLELLRLFPDVGVFLTKDSLLSARAHQPGGAYFSFSLFHLFAPEFLTVYICYFLLLGATLACALGRSFRLFGGVVFILLVSFFFQNPDIFNGGHALVRNLWFFLLFMPTGKSAADVNANGWPLRLLQIQISVVYLSALSYKLLNPIWLDGTALYYVARSSEIARFTPAFLFDNLSVIKLLTGLTLLLELFIPLALWFRRSRKLAVMVGVAFHLMIESSLSIGIFSWVMMLSYLAFFADERSRAGRLRNPLATEATLRPTTP